MKYLALSTLALGLASASPLHVKREVPQEHSHDVFLDIVREFLNLNNPKGILDPVFGLLGNAAAADGAGKIQNLDCLHQATADRAFTNAKAAGDVDGQVAALIFAAVERNTGSVGLKSVLCNETAVNPEIDILSQHQDPASDGAALENKIIALNLAIQIAAVGGQNWSTFLGLLHWMMQLAQMLDGYACHRYDDACAEAGIDVSGDHIIFDFLSAAYQDWLAMDDEMTDEESEARLAPHVEAMARAFELFPHPPHRCCAAAAYCLTRSQVSAFPDLLANSVGSGGELFFGCKT